MGMNALLDTSELKSEPTPPVCLTFEFPQEVPHPFGAVMDIRSVEPYLCD